MTQTLWEALHRMRSKSAIRILWIDAICIDHSRQSERNAQVLNMGKIFSNARSVLVWLGECNLCTQLRSVAPASSSESADIDHAYRRVAALAQDRSGAWWNRVCIVQEVALAKELIVYIGGHTFSWGAFLDIAGSHKSVQNLHEVRGLIHTRGFQEPVRLEELLWCNRCMLCERSAGLRLRSSWPRQRSSGTSAESSGCFPETCCHPARAARKMSPLSKL